jgi:hypothetical protein
VTSIAIRTVENHTHGLGFDPWADPVVFSIRSGLHAGESISSQPVQIPLGRELVASFCSGCHSSFTVEAQQGPQWVTLEAFDLTASETITRNYKAPTGLPCALRFTVKAHHATNLATVITQLRDEELQPVPPILPPEPL